MNETAPLAYATPVDPRATGQASAGRTVLVLAALVPLALVSALIYATAARWMTLSYVRALLVYGYGLLLGEAVWRLCRWARVQQRPLVIFLAMLAVAIAFYVAWVWWILLVTAQLAIKPALLWSLVTRVNQSGVIRTASGPVEPSTLWLRWLAELGVLLYYAYRRARRPIKITPRCPQCGKVTTRKGDVAHLDVTHVTPVQEALANGDLSILGTLPWSEDAYGRWVQINLLECPQCPNFVSLTAFDVQARPKHRTRRLLVENLQISPEGAAWVRGLRPKNGKAPLLAPEILTPVAASSEATAPLDAPPLNVREADSV